MTVLTAVTRFLRRRTGASGAPSNLLSGQPFYNEPEGVLYIGAGDDGAGNSTAQIKIGGLGAFLDLLSAQTVGGIKTFSASPVVPNATAAGQAAAFGQVATALAAYAPLTSPVFGGTPTVPTPGPSDSSAIIANTAWVQALVAAVIAGMQIKPTAIVATAAALPAYAYASSGVLTASVNGALTVDGYGVLVGDLVLVLNETGGNQAYNGLYTVTNAGGGSAKFVLTRHVDMATAAECRGAFVPVGSAGTTTANTLWLCNPVGAVTLGTTALPFTQLNSPTSLVAGAGIALSGNTISIPGYGAVTVGALLKVTSGGLAAAVAGTDYVLPFSSIDPGTA